MQIENNKASEQLCNDTQKDTLNRKCNLNDQHTSNNAETCCSQTSKSVSLEPISVDCSNDNLKPEEEMISPERSREIQVDENETKQQIKSSDLVDYENTQPSCSTEQNATENQHLPVEEDHYILECKMCIYKDGDSLKLELEWIDGDNIELLHQVMQYIKNKMQNLSVGK